MGNSESSNVRRMERSSLSNRVSGRSNIPTLFPQVTTPASISTPRPFQHSASPNLHVEIPERNLPVDPQCKSPLYNLIPAEIRDQILFYCLLEYDKKDEASRYPYNTKYTRPGYTAKKTMNIAFLQTCRRIYLEAYYLPVLTKEHVFFHAGSTAPPHQSHPRHLFGWEIEFEYFRRFQHWQLAQ